MSTYAFNYTNDIQFLGEIIEGTEHEETNVNHFVVLIEILV